MHAIVCNNSFVFYDDIICGGIIPGDVMEGKSFVLVLLTRLNVSEPKH